MLDNYLGRLCVVVHVLPEVALALAPAS
jgi:hypothetical protein